MILEKEIEPETVVKTDARKVSFVGKCFRCPRKIYSNERHVNLHGIFLCSDETLSQEIFAFEDELSRLGELRLVRLSNGRTLNLKPL